MEAVIKTIILALFGIIVFFKRSFHSELAYWLTYVVIFALIPLWWIAAFWVSEKKAKSIVKDFDSSFFVGMVSGNPNDDLIRGRLCLTKEEVKLVGKAKGQYKVIWTEKRSNITSVATGKVAGIRKGIIIYTDKSETSFVTGKAEEIQKVLI